MSRRVLAWVVGAAYVAGVVAVTAVVTDERAATYLAPIVVAFTLPAVSRRAVRWTGAAPRERGPLLELAAVLSEVGDAYDTLATLEEATARATGATSVEIILAGQTHADEAVRADHVVDAVSAGVVVGRVAFSGVDAAATDLEALGAQLAPAIRSVVMRAQLADRVAELEAKAAELEAARRRIVELGDAERRTLERDLHDGAQQCLMALLLRLGLRTAAAKNDAADLLAEARRTMVVASGGWAAAALDRAGLDEALRRHVATSDSITITSRGLGDPLPPAVVRAAFFVCVEAVTNALKHAQPCRRIDVELERDDTELRFSVDDDGPGFDPAARVGLGLAAAADRVAALGGRLDVRSSPGDGTRVAGILPVDAGVTASAVAS